jgi:hypothetical protein
MSLLYRVVLPTLAVVGLGFLIACGGGTNNNVPPPSGGFSNANFNGTYTFSIAGSDTSPNINPVTGAASLEPYSMAGTITASNGKLTAGTVDILDATGVIAAAAPINATASAYNVNKNGIGTMTLNMGTQVAPRNFTFVLTDAAHGLIMENDQTASGATGSGTIDLQPNAVTLADGSYAFSLSGGTSTIDQATGSTVTTTIGLVGGFTLASGTISAGLVDLNDNGVPSTAIPLTGQISTGTGTSPGSAVLKFGSATLNLDVYAIDVTHLKLIERDTQAVLIGDLFSQPSTSIPTATLAFTMAGLDSSGNPLAVGGTVVSDGSSKLNPGSEDINDNGTVDNNGTSASQFTGGFGISPTGNTNGRYAVTLASFTGGTNFAAYPSSGGILMLEVDAAGTFGQSGGITAGTALAQNSPAGVVASQGYALNLTGFDLVNGTELDQIAQFNTASSKLSSGAIYQNDFQVGFNNYGLSSSSTLTPGANGEVVLSFNGGNEGALYYGVDSATSLALGIDNGDVSLGVLQQQGSPTSTADVAARHLAMIKAAASAHAAKKKKQL